MPSTMCSDMRKLPPRSLHPEKEEGSTHLRFLARLRWMPRVLNILPVRRCENEKGQVVLPHPRGGNTTSFQFNVLTQFLSSFRRPVPHAIFRVMTRQIARASRLCGWAGVVVFERETPVPTEAPSCAKLDCAPLFKGGSSRLPGLAEGALSRRRNGLTPYVNHQLFGGRG
jgi:hypothetical protein